MTLAKTNAAVAIVGIAFAFSLTMVQAASALAVTCVGTPSVSNITWTASSTGGVAPVAFAWGNGATTSSQVVAVTPGTYSMNLQGTDASSTVATTTCQATVAIPAPTISSFTASPASIVSGQGSVLGWTVANASSTILSSNTFSNVVSSTSVTVFPTTNTTYTLTAVSPTGTTTATATVTVTPATTTQPVITSFAANPSTITVGQSTTLSWAVSNASTTSINNGLGTISSTSIKVSPSVTTTYQLSAVNPNGTTTANVTVVVNPVATSSPVSSQIASLLAQIAALRAQIFQLIGGSGTTTPPTGGTGTTTLPINGCLKFNKVLKFGDRGSDVRELQQVLASDPTILSQNYVTGFYGIKTQKALQKYVEKYKLGTTTGSFNANLRSVFRKHCNAKDLMLANLGSATSSSDRDDDSDNGKKQKENKKENKGRGGGRDD